MEGHTLLNSAQAVGSCTICLAPLFRRAFSVSPKSSCKKLFCRWKKNACVSFPTIDLAESDHIVAEPPKAARPVGREITFFEELACCPALLESDTHEEVPTQGKEGSCRCFMKRVKKLRIEDVHQPQRDILCIREVLKH